MSIQIGNLLDNYKRKPRNVAVHPKFMSDDVTRERILPELGYEARRSLLQVRKTSKEHKWNFTTHPLPRFKPKDKDSLRSELEYWYRHVRKVVADDKDSESTSLELYNRVMAGGIHNWDISLIKDMSNLFTGLKEWNEGIQWDTSHVTNMHRMFFLCKTFNKPFGEKFDTSNVTNMSEMFSGCFKFNQSLGLKFNTSNVTNMSQMFAYCIEFNQTLGDHFDTSNVTDMSGMFHGCYKFNEPLGDSFDTSKVTDMSGMFFQCVEFNQSLGNKFNTSEVKNMNQMFFMCRGFNQPLGNEFYTKKVDSTNHMFFRCYTYDQELPASICKQKQTLFNPNEFDEMKETMKARFRQIPMCQP